METTMMAENGMAMVDAGSNAAMAAGLLDKAITRKEVAIGAAVVVGVAVLYKGIKFGYKKYKASQANAAVQPAQG